MRSFVILILICTAAWSCTERQAKEISIIPLPVEMVSGPGEYSLGSSATINFEAECLETQKIVEMFVSAINEKIKGEISKQSNPDGDITIAYSNETEKYGEEGYSLEVTKSGIEIIAAKPAGVFYATQTILQLLPVSVYDKTAKYKDILIPAVRIFDKPRFSWRGNMLDPSRHFIEIDFIKQNLDYLASLKMNRFHWHLTDDQGWRIEIKALPNLTEIGAWRVDRNTEPWGGRMPQQDGEETTYGGFYTQEEIREIVEYAAERYISIVPEIDMPGHSQAALASYNEISCDEREYFVATGGVMRDNAYCPGKEITFDFVEKVLGEVIDLFPYKYIHIGGDECNKDAWSVCDDCQQRIKDEGLANEHELQSYFITRVEAFINSKGRQMIGWDEILEGGLAPNATVMSWRGEAGGIEAVKSGHDVVMSPNSYCYLDLKQGDPDIEPDLGYGQLLLTTVYSYNPIPSGFSEEEASHILGVQGNLWGESMQNPDLLNYMLFPRMFALAEVAWSPQEIRDFDSFVPRMELALEKLEMLGINFARSAYNVSIDVKSDPEEGTFSFMLSTEMGNVDIAYTLDGSDPTEQSSIYTGAVVLDGTTTVKAVSVKDGHVVGKITSKELILHKAAGKAISLKTEPSEKYNPGAQSLSDCLRGSSELFNRNWLGFLGNDLEAVVDLAEESEINSVTCSFLQNTGSWIFLPSLVEIYVSSDGENYQLYDKEVTPEDGKTAGKGITEYTFTEKARARYVKVRAKNYGPLPSWHPGAGSKAWLFVDEIIIN